MTGGIEIMEMRVVVMTILTAVSVSPPYCLVRIIGNTAAGIAACITSTFFSSGDMGENLANNNISAGRMIILSPVARMASRVLLSFVFFPSESLRRS